MEAITLTALTFFALAWIGRKTGRLTPFSRSRSKVSMITFTGENLAVVLSVVAITSLLLTGALDLNITDRSLINWLVGLSVVIVACLAAAPRMTLAIIAPIALAAELWKLAVEHGPEAALTLAAWSVAMLWVLGLVRGFFNFGLR